MGTEVLFSDASMYAAMVDVRVPTTNATLAASLPLQLLTTYSTWVPVYDIGSFGGPVNTFYVRVSCQVYNERSDYEMLGRAILALLSAATMG
jgi:hypothetical protein